MNSFDKHLLDTFYEPKCTFWLPLMKNSNQVLPTILILRTPTAAHKRKMTVEKLRTWLRVMEGCSEVLGMWEQSFSIWSSREHGKNDLQWCCFQRQDRVQSKKTQKYSGWNKIEAYFLLSLGLSRQSRAAVVAWWRQALSFSFCLLLGCSSGPFSSQTPMMALHSKQQKGENRRHNHSL